MTRSSMPTLHCDYDGLCDEWSIDYYEVLARSVGDTMITRSERAPGWLSDRLYDYCPEHKVEGENQ